MTNCICITHTAKYRCRFYDNGTGGCDKPNEMERNTRTTLGALRIGDRFYFANDKHKQVHEVTGQLVTQAEVNIPLTVSNTYQYKFPLLRKHSYAVVFLRHTVDSIIENDELKGIV